MDAFHPGTHVRSPKGVRGGVNETEFLAVVPLLAWVYT